MERTKVYIGVLLTLVLSMAITRLTRAQDSTTAAANCWDEITSCIQKNVNSITSSQILTSNPTCCPLIRQSFQNDRKCFCTAYESMLPSDPIHNHITRFISICNVDANKCQAQSGDAGNKIGSTALTSSSLTMLFAFFMSL